METSPHRIAAIVLLGLLLSGFGVWQWLHTRPVPAWQDRPETAAHAGIRSAKAVSDNGRQARAERKATADQCGKMMNAALHAHAASLKQRQDAQSQIGYALAAPFTVFGELAQTSVRDIDAEVVKRRFEQQRAESQQAFARARALAPDNPDIPWLAAIQCGVDEACQGVREELLAAEPDNAAAWLREMTWARIRNDKAGVERAFQRAADASRYDRHAGASQLAILQSFSAMRMPAACEAEDVQAELQDLFPGQGKVGAADFVLAIATSLAGIEAPAYMEIRGHCSLATGSGLDVKRRKTCERVLERMAGSDSLLDQAIALGLLVELAGDGDDAVRWRERYREFQWLRAHMGKPVFQGLTMEDYAFDEMGAMQRALEAQGLWPAPAGWLPRDERARSLIQTGRPPPDPRR